jgi:preprotein translocase subunit YajC
MTASEGNCTRFYRPPMEPLIVLAVTFVLLWVLFIRPQQRRVRGHQALIASLEAGDTVVLTAGIYGRIVDLGPEDMTVEVAPGVELRVARQAVLRRVDDTTGDDDWVPEHPGPQSAGPSDAETGAATAVATGDETGNQTDAAREPAAPEPDDQGPAAPGSTAAS